MLLNVCFFFLVQGSVYFTVIDSSLQNLPVLPPKKTRLCQWHRNNVLKRLSGCSPSGMWQKAATTRKSGSTSVCDDPDQKFTDFKHLQEAWSFDSYIFVRACVCPSRWIFLWPDYMHHLETTQTWEIHQLAPIALEQMHYYLLCLHIFFNVKFFFNFFHIYTFNL